MRKGFFATILAGALSAWASNASVTRVDATTQATIHNNIKFVVPLTVGTDSAVIKWTDTKNRSRVGTVVLTYGLSGGSTTDRPVTSAEATALTFTLKSLTPKSTYKIRLQVTQASGAHPPCADTISITTLPTTNSIRQIAVRKDLPLEMLDNSVRLGSQVQSNDRLIVSDCQGRTLLNHKVCAAEKAVSLPAKAKGIYFLAYTREGKILDQKKFVITNK
jgi:hypothetical protein